MAKPCSQDLRERVVAAVGEGRSRHAVAKLFRVSASAVIKWTKRFDTTGSVAAKPMGGVRRDVLGDQRIWLRARLAAKPDLTLEALRGKVVAILFWTNFDRTPRNQGVLAELNAIREIYRDATDVAVIDRKSTRLNSSH